MTTCITVMCDTVLQHAQGRIADSMVNAERMYQQNIDQARAWENRKRRFIRRKTVTREQIIALMEKNAPEGRGALHLRNQQITSQSVHARKLIRAAAANVGRLMTLSLEDVTYLRLPPR